MSVCVCGKSSDSDEKGINSMMHLEEGKTPPTQYNILFLIKMISAVSVHVHTGLMRSLLPVVILAGEYYEWEPILETDRHL